MSEFIDELWDLCSRHPYAAIVAYTVLRIAHNLGVLIAKDLL
jgi:hypothetical protein